MQLIYKYNKRVRFLLCVIDIYTKYAWVTPLKNKKGVTITNVSQRILDVFGHKPNKIRVDQGGELCNRSMNSWLHNNDFEMFSTHNKGKSVDAERFIIKDQNL